MTKDPEKFINSVELASSSEMAMSYPKWYMEMQDLGFNYRLSEIHAALGLSQLTRAEEGINRRREIAKKYFLAFQDKPYIIGQSGLIEGHAYHLYVIEVDDRLGLYNFLRENNIFSQVHYIPCHLMPYYQNFGWKIEIYLFQRNIIKLVLHYPFFPDLSDEQVSFVINKIYTFFDE